MGVVTQLRVGHGEVESSCAVRRLKVVGNLKFVEGLMDFAFGEEDGSEGGVRGGDLRLEADKTGKLTVRSGEIILRVGRGASAESCVCCLKVAFGRGGVCLRSSLRVRRKW